jgi:ribosomal protein S27AE
MAATKMKCPSCGREMNHHADKLAYSAPGEPGYDPLLGGSVEQRHQCGHCGASASRLSVN